MYERDTGEHIDYDPFDWTIGAQPFTSLVLCIPLYVSLIYLMEKYRIKLEKRRLYKLLFYFNFFI